MSSRPHGTQKQIQIQNLLRFITVAEDLRNDTIHQLRPCSSYEMKRYK